MSSDPISEPYDQDGLHSAHNHEFMADPRFLRAYARGVQAAGQDYKWHWRVHTGLWAAQVAATLEGDFVECGVNRGFLSSAIMQYVNWNALGKRFFLLDTFAGLDFRYVSEAELAEGIRDKNQHAIDSGFYTFDVEAVRRNFAEWAGTVVIQGTIPETLPQITTDKVAFASIDLNCSPPEVAALEYLWDRLVPGALVLLDDYAFIGYRQQKLGMDAFADRVGVEVLSLPTGQGLIIKPGHRLNGRLTCAVCGGRAFRDRKVLWDGLIEEWQLSPEEADYINRQQGTHCQRCLANMRSIALAKAILTVSGRDTTLQDWADTEAARALAVLEINEAGTLSALLRRLPGHVLAEFPQVDATNLPYADASFDLVVHSDTLEHVGEPLRALADCRRVLKPGGALCFTVPIVVGRMSRSRAGLPNSYHGNAACLSEDWAVRTEFGADAWTYVVRAGFETVSLVTLDYPTATAMLARKEA